MRPEPFAYSTAAHKRRHGPSGWPYRLYRPWLRDEFSFRCVFCLRRERWVGARRGTFHLDHCVPQTDRPDLRDDYCNLLYTCGSCNELKQHYKTVDPCQVPLATCITVRPDGKIRWLNGDGRRLVKLLGLDDPTLERFRADLIAAITASDDEYFRWMRYPDELPDLSLPPTPPFNSKPEGVMESCYARKLRGELSDVY